MVSGGVAAAGALPDIPVLFGEERVKVLIGVPLTWGHVPAEAARSLWCLDVPADNHVVFQDGVSVAHMREEIARLGLEGGFSHVFMADADMVYPKDCLTTLLSSGVEVVCGFSVQRRPPHLPLFGRSSGKRYLFRPTWPTDSGEPAGVRVRGLHEAAVVGGCGLLVRTDVFRRLERPWFSLSAQTDDGQPVGEDVFFSQRCRDAGIPLHCHVDVIVGHLASVNLVPTWLPTPGRWEIEVQGVSRGETDDGGASSRSGGRVADADRDSDGARDEPDRGDRSRSLRP
jgi:hypothetical protein